MPRLLDSCALFSAANAPLVERLLASAFSAAPWLRADAADAGAAAAENVEALRRRCSDALAAATRGGASAAALDAARVAELLDATSYFADACSTLAAFAEHAPPDVVAEALLSGGGAQLLPALAALHDALAPQLRASGEARLRAAAALVQATCASASWALLNAAFLKPRGGRTSNADAAARADALQLTLLSMGATEADAGEAALLRRLGAVHDVPSALAASGLRLGAEQRATLLLAFGADDGAGGSGSGGDSGAGASSSAAADGVVPSSAIAAVRDVLPDLGDGFVAACLSALGGDAAQVVHALLEGSLPPAVAGLDRSLSLDAWRRRRSGGGVEAAAPDRKGKGKMSSLGAPQQQLLAAVPPPAAAPPLSPRVPSPRPQLQAYRKRGGRDLWERDEALTLLDTHDAAAAAASRAAAHEAQFEEAAEDGALPGSAPATGGDMYDDEYDDTFDDLALLPGAAEPDADEDVVRPAPLPLQPAPPRQPPPKTTARAPAPPPPRPKAVPLPTPAERRPSGAQPQRASSYWVLNGRVYTYAKEGAELVSASSAEDASRIAAERAAAAAATIHGLGAGGNHGAPASGGAARGGVADADESSDEDGDAGASGAGGGPGRSAPGGGRGQGGRGRGRGGDDARAHARKEHNKAAVGNHHRKDRAAHKQRALLGPM